MNVYFMALCSMRSYLFPNHLLSGMHLPRVCCLTLRQTVDGISTDEDPREEDRKSKTSKSVKTNISYDFYPSTKMKLMSFYFSEQCQSI